MNISNLVSCFCIFMLYGWKSSEACNGYSIKLNHAKNCMTGGVITFAGDSNVVLDKDCNLAMAGCVEITKDFATHKVKYTINKAPMPPIEGEADACEVVKNIKDATLLSALKTFSVPLECPIKAEKICSTLDNKVNIGKYKNQLGMAAGTIDVKVESTHDSGKSCLEMNFTLAKEKRAG
ncbi:uncharacterized protein LOC123684314 [Harmonia axyridis]|uniref:uncharacterized protein LOC123684314 n=1 Tax=Harmonia axyridis TaxID=115357 RepID=UPI001E27858A|nr:uncharacterized protein LOC123684314 [Harmonia axyridis]